VFVARRFSAAARRKLFMIASRIDEAPL